MSKLLVVIPCTMGKRPATLLPRIPQEHYIGRSFRSALRAANHITKDNDEIALLSAKYGLVRLDQELENYSLKMGDPGSVTASRVREQLEGWKGWRQRYIVGLLPAAYDKILVEAVKPSKVHNPLRGAGIQVQWARLRRIWEGRLRLEDFDDVKY